MQIKNTKLYQDLIKNYNEKEAKYFSNKYNVSINSIYNLVCKLKITHHSNIDQYKQEILGDYKNGLTIEKIRKKYHAQFETIKSIIKESKIPFRPISFYAKKYKINEDYFKKINSNEKSYWLGFLYADGNLCNGKLQIRLAKKDKNHLYKFRKSLNSNHKIFLDKNSGGYGIIIANKKIYNYLLNLDLTPNKSLTLKFPSTKIVPKKYINSFMLGYFDGDGSICKNKGHWVFQIISTKEFCLQYQKYMVDFLNWNDKGIRKEERTKENVWYYGIGGGYKLKKSKKRLNKIVKFLYKNCNIFLKRKFNKFQEMLNYDK